MHAVSPLQPTVACLLEAQTALLTTFDSKPGGTANERTVRHRLRHCTAFHCVCTKSGPGRLPPTLDRTTSRTIRFEVAELWAPPGPADLLFLLQHAIVLSVSFGTTILLFTNTRPANGLTAGTDLVVCATHSRISACLDPNRSVYILSTLRFAVAQTLHVHRRASDVSFDTAIFSFSSRLSTLASDSLVSIRDSPLFKARSAWVSDLPTANHGTMTSSGGLQIACSHADGM